MSDGRSNIRIIISGGGTGGHLFPAIAIANALKRLKPEAEILFVGATGRMEMQKVPEAGYEIEGLPVAGFVRGMSLKNFQVIGKLFRSMLKSRKIIRRYKPNVVVGVGGYASGPILKQAQRMHIPTLIQEQNSYAGVTNKLLAKKAGKICVAYEGMEKYFPKDKIILTGNPVRLAFDNLASLREEALEHFKLDGAMPVILVLGGSLGAGTINSSVGGGIGAVEEAGAQMIWQTGSHYYDRMREMTDAAAHRLIYGHRLHQPHGPCVCRRRYHHITCRRRNNLRAGTGGQTRNPCAVTQCGRGSPDTQCNGPGE